MLRFLGLNKLALVLFISWSSIYSYYKLPNSSDLSTLKSICLLIGELFQAQDDMLDCFADPDVIGKVGRDIEEGKCTWLLYTAMEALRENDKHHELNKELIQLYSETEKSQEIVDRIKEIYKAISIESRFEKYSQLISLEINSTISTLSTPQLQHLCTWLLESTMTRRK